MSDVLISGMTEACVLLTSGSGEVVMEGIGGALLILIGYHYMQLATGDGDRDQEHRRRLLQTVTAFGGFAYFSALLAPTLDLWPVRLGMAIQLEIGHTADKIAANLARDGFVGWLYRLGLAVYVVFVSAAAVAIRIPVVIWQSLVRN